LFRSPATKSNTDLAHWRGARSISSMAFNAADNDIWSRDQRRSQRGTAPGELSRATLTHALEIY
jgi:hypothetical protein